MKSDPTDDVTSSQHKVAHKASLLVGSPAWARKRRVRRTLAKVWVGWGGVGGWRVGGGRMKTIQSVCMYDERRVEKEEVQLAQRN